MSLEMVNAQANLAKTKQKTTFIDNSLIVFGAYASAFFSRSLETLGAPSVINFAHFMTVPLALIIVLATNQNHEKQAIAISKKILWGLFFFFLATLISAMVNGAGMINTVLNFMLLGEPFLLLVAIILVPISLSNFTKIKNWFIAASFFHLFLAFFQKYILKVENWHHLGMEGADRIQGIFFISGAGHVVGSAVSLSFSLYYLVNATRTALWLRISVCVLSLWHLIFADAKQVLLVFMVAGIVLAFTRLDNIETGIKYILAGIIFIAAFIWCLQNVAAFSAFNVWIRPEIYGTDGEATLLKTATFRIVPTYYDSLLNWFFGLGPGHTVGRLGGWMLKEYADLLEPLGSTRHAASGAVWKATGESWLGDQSSMFSPLFGWAGIWGDLGLIGLGLYLYLAFLVWHYVCRQDVSQLLLLTVFFFGCIFSQMEEPGYMLSIAFILGLTWQESRIKKYLKARTYLRSRNLHGNA